MSLARRFNAGISVPITLRRVATIECAQVQASLRDVNWSVALFPGLEKAGLNSDRRYAPKTYSDVPFDQ